MESDAEGWVEGALTCTITPADGGDPFELGDLSDFTVGPGDVAACTAENARHGTIVVAKVVDGADGTFDFTGDWQGAEDFSITTEDGLGTATFDDVAPGSYTVEEIAQDGFENTDLVCIDGDSDGTGSGASGGVGTIALDPGETVVCTYTNAPWGVLVVDKQTAPAGSPQEFEFTWGAVGGQTDTFTLTDAAEPFSSGALAPGEYLVTEGSVPGWDLTGVDCTGSATDPVVDLPGVTVEVGLQETVLCTFTNAAVPGSLTVEKSVTGWAAGAPWSFELILSGPAGAVPRTVTDEAPSTTWEDLEVGASYSLVESDPGAGWTDELTCTGVDDEDAEAPGLQFTVTPSVVVSCEATNAAEPADVTVTKAVAGLGAGVPWEFQLSISPDDSPEDGTQTVSGPAPGSESASWSGLVPGTTYTLSEEPVPGWTGTTTCTGVPDADPAAAGFQLVAQPGTSVACTTTNVAAQGAGTLTKTSVGGDGTFQFVLTPLPDGAPVVVPLTTTGGSGSAPLPALVPGQTYALTETPTPGWEAGEIDCTVAPAEGEPVDADPASLVVEPGGTIACSAENVALGRVVVVKAVDGADGTFGFTGDWQGAEDFSITTEDGLGTATFDDVAPGSYTVEEIAQDGFENTDLVCIDGDPDGTGSGASGGVGTIALDPGETVVCTFTNAPWGTLVVDKVTEPAGSSQEFGLAWAPEGGEPTAFTLTDAAEPFTPGPLAPGTYTVTETPTPGWTLADLACVGSSGSTTVDGATATVDVLSGETVLCTFTNARPTALEVTKSVVDGPDVVEPGVFRIAYEVAVSNTATAARTYDLVDRLAFGGGIVVRDASVESLDGVPVADDWDGVDQPTVTSGATLAAGAAHRYRVTVVAQVPADVVPDALLCDPAGTEAGGFLNTVGVLGEDGATESEAAACAPAPGPPEPPQPPGPPDGGEGAAPPGPTAPDRPLPATGTDTGWLLAAAGLLLLAGGALLLVRRVRRS